MRADGATTRQRLLEAGEHLFATRGLDVPLAEIQRAAGQRNKSALHYYFESRDGLLHAIVEDRLAQIERERRALLDALAAEGRAPTARELVQALVVPLANRLQTTRGRHYLMLLPQLVPRMGLRSGAGTALPSGLEQTMEGLKAQLGHRPPAETMERMAIVAAMNAAVMADRARMLQDGGPVLVDHDRFVELVVDMVTSALTA